MRTRALVAVLLATLLQSYTQAQPDSETSQIEPPAPREGDKQPDSLSEPDPGPAAPKPAAEFQPSEEIMADTMLTLPADI